MAKELNRLMIVALLGIALLATYFYTVTWDVARNFPFSIEYEGHIFWACVKLAQGENIYSLSALQSEPWSVIIYNPVFIGLGAALIKLCGLTLWPLRLVSMASLLVSTIGLGTLVHRCKASDFATVTAMVLFATCLPAFYWSTLARVDMLGLALAIWGMERFAAAWLSDSRRPSDPRYFVSAALYVLAFFTKQQYFVFPLASLLFCLLQRQVKLAGALAVGWAACVIGGGMALQAITGGGYLAHLSFAAGLPWEYATIDTFLLPFLRDPVTMAATAVIVLGNMTRMQRQPLETMANLLLAVSFSLALYTIGLRGAAHNHLLCTEFALFWVAALNLQKLPQVAAAPMLVGASMSMVALQGFCWHLSHQLELYGPTRVAMQVLKRAHVQGKVVLSEDPTLAMFAGATPAMVDATTFLNLGRQHPERLQDLLAAINNKEFAAVVINTPDANRSRDKIWTRQVVYAIKKNYRRAADAGGNGESQSVFLPL